MKYRDQSLLRKQDLGHVSAVADLGGFQGFHGTPFWLQL